MNCPVCANAMVEMDFGGVVVDVCETGCKGIWFDWMELGRLDETHEGAGRALEAALSSPRVNDADRGKINCPKCGKPMQIHKYKRAKAVSVDECYLCGGFFLDSGELTLIRDEYMTDAEHAEYVEQLVASTPGVPEYQEDLEKRYARARAMLHMTRFVRPRYFVPKMLGKETYDDKSIALHNVMEKYRKDPSSVRSPELKALLDKYKQIPENKRTPEQRAVVDQLSPAFG